MIYLTMSDIIKCPDIKRLTLEAHLNKDNRSILSKIDKDIIFYFENFDQFVDLDLVQWMESEAHKNNFMAQCNLGYMYQFGLGVGQDYKKAVELYLLS